MKLKPIPNLPSYSEQIIEESRLYRFPGTDRVSGIMDGVHLHAKPLLKRLEAAEKALTTIISDKDIAPEITEELSRKLESILAPYLEKEV